jgi:hypothetical protein
MSHAVVVYRHPSGRKSTRARWGEGGCSLLRGVVNALSFANSSNINSKQVDTVERIIALSAHVRTLFMVLRVSTFAFFVNGFVGVELVDVSRGIFRAPLYGGWYPSLVFNDAARCHFKQDYAKKAWGKLEAFAPVSLSNTPFCVYVPYMASSLGRL